MAISDAVFRRTARANQEVAYCSENVLVATSGSCDRTDSVEAITDKQLIWDRNVVQMSNLICRSWFYCTALPSNESGTQCVQ